MPDKEILKKIAELTCDLSPGPGTGAEDLTKARRVLAEMFAFQPKTVEMIPPRLGEELGAFTGVLDELDPGLKEEINDLASEAVLLRESTEKPAGGALRVFRRESPVLSSLNRNSRPSWAAGRRVDETVGPFTTPDGRLHWFDIYRPVQMVSIVRIGSANPILMIPLRVRMRGQRTGFELPKGSVWILSSLLCPQAPADSYTGLTIKGGRVSLSAPAQVAQGIMHIGQGVVLDLELTLDPKQDAAPKPGPGADAGAAECKTPQKVKFKFNPAEAELVKADQAGAKVYGKEYKLKKADQDPWFEASLNRILFPFTSNLSEVMIADLQSELFSPAGKASLEKAAWGLVVTVCEPEDLGEAEGAGALVLCTGPGLWASWRGQNQRLRLNTHILVDPGRLIISSSKARGPGAHQSISLWQEDEDTERRSVVSLNYSKKTPLRYFCEASGREMLLLGGIASASLSKPIQANSRRLNLKAQNALISFVYDQKGFSFVIAWIRPGISLGSDRLISLALTNALFTTTPIAGMAVMGELNKVNQADKGAVALCAGVYGILPFLPDPYAANLSARRPLPQASAGYEAHREFNYSLTSVLFVFVNWQVPQKSELSLIMAGAPGYSLAVHGLAQESPEPEPDWDMPEKTRHMLEQDRDRQAGLRNIFEETAGPASEIFKMIDLSTNCDHFGVGFDPFGQKKPATHGGASGAGDSGLRIQELSLSITGSRLRLITTPLIQWEPVWTVQNPAVGYFPSPMASAGDGGPTIIGSNTVTLVPIKPQKVLANLLNEYNGDGSSVPMGAQFTLPFGMKAAANLIRSSGIQQPDARVELIQPRSFDDALLGGLQIRLEALSPDHGPDAASPSFQGATIQLRNGVDPVTGHHLGKSVLSGGGTNQGVEYIFNQEMEPSAPTRKVPVTRLDISGYGASMFSDWYNPKAAVAATSQVRLDVLVGRTAHEVVQVKSILYPWGVPVVRTITIERRKEGLVYRHDSGWLSMGPGLYKYPDPDPGPSVSLPPNWAPVKTHPGAIKAVHLVRNIRETGRMIEKDLAGLNVAMAEVRFDGDFEITGALKGQNADNLVPGQGHVGFVQMGPFGIPLGSEQLKLFLEEEGPLGGPVDCVIDVAESGQLMQVVRVEVAPAPHDHGMPPCEFAAVAKGGLNLPDDGDWAVLRHDLIANEPRAVDPDSGVPLVRAGHSDHAYSPVWQIADAHDLLLSLPLAEYCLMQSSSAHRVLFPKPRIKSGEKKIIMEKPVLADAFAMMENAGLFPERSRCFTARDSHHLAIRDDGRYGLKPKKALFPVPAGQDQRHMSDTASFKIYVDYPTGSPSKITFTLDPDASPAWVMEQKDLGVVMDLGPLEGIMTVKHRFLARDGEPASMEEPEMIYGSALAVVVVPVLSFLKLLGLDAPFGVSFSNQNPRMKASLRINILNPWNPPDNYISLGALHFKGSLGLGLSNDPNSLPAQLTMPSGTPEAEAIGPGWHGYFWVEFGSKIPIVLPVFGEGVLTFILLGNELIGQVVVIKLTWGATITGDLGVLKAEGKFYFGIIVVAAQNTLAVGMFVGIAGTASVLNGMFAITIKVELTAMIVFSPEKMFVGQAMVAAEITICWFLTISFETQVEMQEKLST